MDDNELKKKIATNIAKYRKQHNITQLELAEKLNYSDKAVSKWERGEAVPDIYILQRLSEIFKITVNDLLCEKPVRKIYIGLSIEKRVIIPIMAVLLTFFLATIAFVIMTMLPAEMPMAWLSFIYAIPAAAICAIVFCAIWRKKLLTVIFASVLAWSIALIVILSVTNPSRFLLFIIPIPFQILIILWYIMGKISRQRKKKAQQQVEN